MLAVGDKCFCRGRPGTCTQTHKRNQLDTKLHTKEPPPAITTHELYSLSPQISERDLKLKLLLGKCLHFLNEVLKGRLEFVPHFTLHLLGVQVVSVVHVLVLAQVCGNLSHLCVELYICMALLPKHDGVLIPQKTHTHTNGNVEKIVKLSSFLGGSLSRLVQSSDVIEAVAISCQYLTTAQPI